MNRMLLFLLTLVTLIVLPGCDYRILERIGFTYAGSYDLVEDNQIEVGISIPRADPTIKLVRELHSAIGKSSKDVRLKFAQQTDLLLVNGQIRVLLYSEALARKSLSDQIKGIVRDTSISPLVKIAIVNGNAKELLFKNYKQHLSTDKYINRLLEKESTNHQIPRTTLYEFERDYYDDGVDPVAPVIKDDGENITTDGIALFRDYDFVGKINSKDALVFCILRGNFKKGSMSLDLNSKNDDNAQNYIMFTSMISSKKVYVEHKANEPIHVVIKAMIKGSIHEYIGDLKLSDDAQRHQIENKVSQLLSERANRIMKQLQEKKVDSLGIGMHVRNSMSYKDWKGMNWREVYPEVKVDCQLHFKAKDYGKAR
ncbi:Ger(x)C family spore germination protein [Paenibacillus lupini]|uniref:Ger(x)C family spore germination protein n=1 Tax=Paenibacillus lupini TaxID=1450204 RepID=UPI00141E9583|nr:Ger(x)C family spore germination protein [Paenibacillus lupini]NIK21495.1 spore germination protein [Paenibacillus lupini]